MAEDLERLVVSMAADFKSFENAMTRASGMSRKQLAQMKADTGAVGAAADAGFRRFGNAAKASQGNVINFRSALSNMGLQAQDVAVQLSMGTSALRVFGQQAPQILGAFGPLGIAIGIAAAALPLLAAAFNDTGRQAGIFDGIAKALDATLVGLKESGFEVTEATELFGASLRRISETASLASIKEMQAQLKEITADATLITAQQIQVTPGIEVLRRSLGLTAEQADRLHAALVAVANAPMDQLVAAAQNAVDVIAEITAETGKINPAMQAVAASVQEAARGAATLAGNTESATGRAIELAGAWQQVLSATQASVASAGDAMRAVARAREATRGPRPASAGGALGAGAADFPLSGVPVNGLDLINAQFPVSSLPSGLTGGGGGGGGGRGGGGGGLSAENKAALEDQRVLQDAIRDAVNDTADAQRELQQETARTASTFADFFVDAVSGARSFEESLAGLAESLAKLVVMRGFEQILMSGQGLGGPLGGFFDFLGGGGLSGTRASGGPVGAGRSYLVGERGPEIFTPKLAGMIHANGSGSGSNVTVNVNNAPAGTQVQERQGPGGTRVIDVMLESKVKDMFAGGKLDGTMARTFGIRRPPGAR